MLYYVEGKLKLGPNFTELQRAPNVSVRLLQGDGDLFG